MGDPQKRDVCMFALREWGLIPTRAGPPEWMWPATWHKEIGFEPLPFGGGWAARGKIWVCMRKQANTPRTPPPPPPHSFKAWLVLPLLSPHPRSVLFSGPFWSLGAALPCTWASACREFESNHAMRKDHKKPRAKHTTHPGNHGHSKNMGLL